MKWRVAAWLMTAMLAITSIFAVATPAQADESGCGSFYPTQGRVTTHWNGSHMSVTLAFRQTQSQLDMLRCTGKYLELDFTFYQVTKPSTSRDYSISTNLPGGIIDVPFLDKTFSPGVTGIYTRLMQANTPYYATIEFDTDVTGTPTVSVGFVASHWARVDLSPKAAWEDVKEKISCNGAGVLLYSDRGWCIFPTARRSITGSLYGWPVPVDGTAYTIDPSNFPSF